MDNHFVYPAGTLFYYHGFDAVGIIVGYDSKFELYKVKMPNKIVNIFTRSHFHMPDCFKILFVSKEK